MKSNREKNIRERLVKHLEGGQAFAPIDKVVDQVPFQKIGIVPGDLPYSFYQQFYHIRFAQLDIFDYCRDEKYHAPNWPDDYWPNKPAPADVAEWTALVKNYFDEREDFCSYLLDPANELYEPFSFNPEHNLLREALLVVEHTSYHVGQLYIIQRLLTEDM